MIISLLFACSDSVMLYSEPSKTWEEEEIDSSRLLLRRQDELLDRIEYRGMPLNITRDIDALNIQEIEVPEGVNMYDLIADLEATEEYEFVEPVMFRSIPTIRRVAFDGNIEDVRAPNDPFYTAGYQPNMDIVQAANLSGNAQGTSGTIVAVIDTGVYTSGGDAPVNILTGYDFVNDDNDATDDQGHGTHVAGTIAQATNNGTGVMGIAPNVSILPVKVLNAQGGGVNTDTIDGINYAVQQGADVINLSLGSTTFSAAEESAVDAAVNAGVAVIGATGNDGDKTGNGTFYPGSYDSAIAVTATDMQGNVTDYSNTGPAVDLSAPGGDIDVDSDNNSYPDGILQETINTSIQVNYYFYEGTSMATPHVAGAFASLMASGASNTEAELYLMSTSVDYGATGKDNDYGEGEIRIQDALDAYLAGGSSSDLTNLNAGDLIITEVMPNPSQVDDWKGEWFEIYNNTGSSIDLNGLVFSSAADLGFTLSTSVTVGANDYALFSVGSFTGTNGGLTGLDHTYSYNNLRLYDSDTLSIAYDGTTFDSVSWDASTYNVTAGASISTRSLSASDNDTFDGWCVGTSTYGSGDKGTPGSANNCTSIASVSSASAGDLVISEIMAAPTVVDYRGEWFEIYNNTGEVMNLNGLQVDSAGNNGFSVSSDLFIPSSEYVVFATRTDSTNGGISQVDYIYSYPDFKLFTTDSITISNGSGTIDSVSYTSSAFGITSGASIGVSSLDASDNDSSIYWCNATSSYGSGDKGTPGADNDSCGSLPISLSTLGAGDLVISEIMIDPTQTADWRGEWFEIYNNSGANVNLNGLIVSSAGQGGFTLSSDLTLAAGSYVVFANRDNSSLNGNLPSVDATYSYNDIKLYGNDSLTIGSSGVSTIDTVVFDTSWDQQAGKSITLDTLSASSNDLSANWCAASSTYGDGDFGTPGTANDSCP